MERLLTVKDVAQILNIKPSSIQQQRYLNTAPGNIGFKVGGRVLFRREAIEDWLADLEASERAS